MKILLLSSVLALLLSCTSKQRLTGAGTSITNTYWELVELDGKSIKRGLTPVAPYLELRASDNRVKGNGGCNGFGGSFTLSGDHGLRFSPLAATKMACATGMDIESLFLEALGKTDSYAISGDTLLLSGNGMLLTRLKAETPANQ